MTVEFDWDDLKERSNRAKHGIAFDLASTVFLDERLLTIADLAHSDQEDRWFSVGRAANGLILSVAYLWSESRTGQIKIRIISARKATTREATQYLEGQ